LVELSLAHSLEIIDLVSLDLGFGRFLGNHRFRLLGHFGLFGKFNHQDFILFGRLL
jgi:hypothetical protein